MSFSPDQVEALLQMVIQQGSGVVTDMTKKVHRTAYPAISPLRPELSQEGKTVLITGGGTNIGLAITKAFVQAGAKTVIIIGRRVEVLDNAKKEILAEAEAGSKKVGVIGKSVDVTDKVAIAGLWADLKKNGVEVDVLVLNAAKFAELRPLLDLGSDAIWEDMEANVHGPLLMAENFSKQGGDARKSIVNISTAAAHLFEKEENVLASLVRSYALTKASGTLAMQLLAADVDPAKLTVVSVHPGLIHTSNWEDMAVPKSKLPFDDVSLPAAAAVWLASPEAVFLHGRFIWASWDVGELKEGGLRKHIDEDRVFLKLGLTGMRGTNRAW